MAARGVDVTCEVAPHHALLTSEHAQAVGPMVRINPPVRPPGHAAALLEGLAG